MKMQNKASKISWRRNWVKWNRFCVNASIDAIFFATKQRSWVKRKTNETHSDEIQPCFEVSEAFSFRKRIFIHLGGQNLCKICKSSRCFVCYGIFRKRKISEIIIPVTALFSPHKICQTIEIRWRQSDWKIWSFPHQNRKNKNEKRTIGEERKKMEFVREVAQTHQIDCHRDNIVSFAANESAKSRMKKNNDIAEQNKCSIFSSSIFDSKRRQLNKDANKRVSLEMQKNAKWNVYNKWKMCVCVLAWSQLFVLTAFFRFISFRLVEIAIVKCVRMDNFLTLFYGENLSFLSRRFYFIFLSWFNIWMSESMATFDTSWTTHNRFTRVSTIFLFDADSMKLIAQWGNDDVIEI